MNQVSIPSSTKTTVLRRDNASRTKLFSTHSLPRFAISVSTLKIILIEGNNSIFEKILRGIEKKHQQFIVVSREDLRVWNLVDVLKLLLYEVFPFP